MTSQIDPTQPAQGSTLISSVIRQLAATAKAEIEALQQEVVTANGKITTLQQQFAGFLAGNNTGNNSGNGGVNPLTGTRWGVNFKVTQDASIVGIGEIEWFVNGVSVSATGIMSDDNHQPYHGGDVAFDGNSATYYGSQGLPARLIIDFTTKTNVDALTLQDFGAPQYAGKDFDIEYFDFTANAWVVVRAITNEPAWTNNEKRSYAFTNPLS